MEPITSVTLLFVLAGIIATVRMKSLDDDERADLAHSEFSDGHRFGYDFGYQAGYDAGFHEGGDEEMKRWLDLDDENARLRIRIGDLLANLAELNEHHDTEHKCCGACQQVDS
jgi:hypothetical protein